MEEVANRISGLPRDLIAYIVAFVPIRDAARTSVLSRTWRYIWTESPSVAIDLPFSNQYYINVVNRILSQRQGPILDFVLGVPALFPSAEFIKIDLWIHRITRDGLQKLSLQNSSPDAYKIPSFVFTCLTLEVLSISNCIFKAPAAMESFKMLTDITLEQITFEPSVLSIPKLACLVIQRCKGTRHFNISAPGLVNLFLISNDDLELSYFINCSDMACACILLSNGVVCDSENKRITLSNLLNNWSILNCLGVNATFLEYIIAGCSRIPTTLNSLESVVIVHFSYDFEEIANILNLIQELPKLCTLKIWSAHKITHTDMEVAELLEEPSVLKQSFSGLQTVKMENFQGSSAELSFVKLFLANCPSMETMDISHEPDMDVTERLQVATQLMRFSRASTKAEIIFRESIKMFEA